MIILRQQRSSSGNIFVDVVVARVVLLVLIVIMVPNNHNQSGLVMAWGKDGHEIVGNVAWMILSNQTKDYVMNLLNLTSTDSNHHDSGSSDCMGFCSPLAQVSDWADMVRNYAPYHWSAPLHYIDIRDDEILPQGCPVNANNNQEGQLSSTSSSCHFNYTRDCPNNTCVAGAIVNFTNNLLLQQQEHHYPYYFQKKYNSMMMMLNSPSMTAFDDSIQRQEQLEMQQRRKNLRYLRKEQPSSFLSSSFNQDESTNHDSYFCNDDKDRIRCESLMFVVHFIGDIHQPLHCSRQTDRGGNSILVHFDATNDEIAENIHYPLNLHGFWDDTFIDKTIHDDHNASRNNFEVALYDYILQIQHTEIYQSKWLNCTDGTNVDCTILWGDESFQYALEYAYRNVDGTDITDGTYLSLEYYETRLPIVRERLALAAVRLARTLEKVVSLSE